MTFHFLLSLVCASLFILPIHADDTLQQSQAQRLAAELGNPVYEKRDAASRSLWLMGEAARPVLELTLQQGNAEAVRRAQLILERFNLGLYPETPPEILELVRQFRTDNEAEQLNVVTKLIQMRERGLPTLQGLLRSQAPTLNRVDLSADYCTILRETIPRMLWKGEDDLVESFLAIHLNGFSTQGWLDYAMFAQSRGHLPAMIQAFEAKPNRSVVHSLALVYLYRVNGQSDKALSLARTLKMDAKSATLLAKFDPYHTNPVDKAVLALLEDRGDWAELVKRNNGQRPEIAAVNTYSLRLAGRDDIVQKHLDAQAVGDGAPPPYPGRPSDDALSLLVNGRPEAGIELIRQAGTMPHIVADLLAVRLEFDRLLKMLESEQAVQETDMQKSLRRDRLAELLAKLGKRDEAEAIFNSEMKDKPDEALPFMQLIRSEMRSQRRDLACDHLATLLSWTIRNDPDIEDPEVFELIFDEDSDHALQWWYRLTANDRSDETPQMRMRLIDKLLHGLATETELADAIKRFRPTPNALPNAPQLSVATTEQVHALAVVQWAHGQRDAAIATLSREADQLAAMLPQPKEPASLIGHDPNGSRSWVFGTDERFVFWTELGDMLMEVNRPAEAAKRYQQGLAYDPSNPILHFLRGQALLAAGQTAEGNRWIAISHRVKLGDPLWRGRFLLELLNRDYDADARIELEQLESCSWISLKYLGNVWSQMSSAAIRFGDFETASRYDQRAIHFMLANDAAAYVEGFAYLRAPIEAQAHHACGLLAEGKVDAAVAEAKACLQTLPGYDELVISMVPELDKRGRKADADALFQTVWNAYLDVVKAYPKSAWGMANAAWTAAGCNRELDAALTYARRAVELAPNDPRFQEALAEVLFRKQDRKAASIIMERLLAEHWRNQHYKKQLTRYRSGPFASPIPDHDE